MIRSFADQATEDVPGVSNMTGRRLPRLKPPPHPGEMLLEEFLRPLGVSQSAFAKRLGVSCPRLNEVVRGRRGVTPDTALRLARVTRMSADFWLGLQQDWDLWHAAASAGAASIAALEPLPRVEARGTASEHSGGGSRSSR